LKSSPPTSIWTWRPTNANPEPSSSKKRSPCGDERRLDLALVARIGRGEEVEQIRIFEHLRGEVGIGGRRANLGRWWLRSAVDFAAVIAIGGGAFVSMSALFGGVSAKFDGFPVPKSVDVDCGVGAHRHLAGVVERGVGRRPTLAAATKHPATREPGDHTLGIHEG
jgi:hypothetical protein